MGHSFIIAHRNELLFMFGFALCVGCRVSIQILQLQPGWLDNFLIKALRPLSYLGPTLMVIAIIQAGLSRWP